MGTRATAASRTSWALRVALRGAWRGGPVSKAADRAIGSEPGRGEGQNPPRGRRVRRAIDLLRELQRRRRGRLGAVLLGLQTLPRGSTGGSRSPSPREAYVF